MQRILHLILKDLPLIQIFFPPPLNTLVAPTPFGYKGEMVLERRQELRHHTWMSNAEIEMMVAIFYGRNDNYVSVVQSSYIPTLEGAVTAHEHWEKCHVHAQEFVKTRHTHLRGAEDKRLMDTNAHLSHRNTCI
jgi:hypothetical protein